MRSCFILLLFIACSCLQADQESIPFVQEQEVSSFISHMVKDYQFDEKQLQDLFSQIKILQKSLHAMRHSAEKTNPWHQYQKIFLTQKRIQEGVVYWQAHEKVLASAEKKYGVPAKMIVAILGVETFYGSHMGKYRVIDALATHAFRNKKRSTFFKKELEQYLLLCREMRLNPLTISGSYAGAMGQTQFIPSSYRQYAVDFSGDGKIDLFYDSRDVIGSVANYFKENGWVSHAPIAVRAKVIGDDYKSIKQHHHKTAEMSLEKLNQYHIMPAHTVHHAKQAVFLEFDGKDKNDYWLGFHNFDVIMRYNKSPLYALATFLLGEEIEKRHAEVKT